MTSEEGLTKPIREMDSPAKVLIEDSGESPTKFTAIKLINILGPDPAATMPQVSKSTSFAASGTSLATLLTRSPSPTFYNENTKNGDTKYEIKSLKTKYENNWAPATLSPKIEGKFR